MTARFAAFAAAAALVLAACGSDADPVATTTLTRPPTTSPPSTSAAPKPPSASERRATAMKQVKAVIANQPDGGVSVAALNTATGASFVAGARSGVWTASAYKLFVLEALMRNGSLSDYEASTAVPMMENSDNAAGYSLFLAAGGRSALENTAQQFGMTHTVPGYSDPTFTRTSGRDCLQLLKNLVGPGQFDKSQRDFALNLMRNVERDQRWGVGVTADKGSTFANKNGWLSIENNGPGESDNGLWAVTSLGIVTIGGDQVLMAVLTQHQSDFDTGVALVEKLARLIAPAVRR